MEKLGMIIWMLCALLFAVIGVIDLFAKKPVGFFANVKEPPKVRDVKAYNRAVGRLWIGFAVVFALLGLPLRHPQSALVLFSILGTMAACIVLMIAYLRIEQKYIK